jgi:hypothetical protein
MMDNLTVQLDISIRDFQMKLHRYLSDIMPNAVLAWGVRVDKPTVPLMCEPLTETSILFHPVDVLLIWYLPGDEPLHATTHIPLGQSPERYIDLVLSLHHEVLRSIEVGMRLKSQWPYDENAS